MEIFKAPTLRLKALNKHTHIEMENVIKKQTNKKMYILGKWLQKEDITETAVHFVLKWGFEVNLSASTRTLQICWVHVLYSIPTDKTS